MRPSLILQTGTRWAFHTILLFSVFLLFAGHNRPGGGFIGGLVAGAAVVLRYVAFGVDDLRRTIPVAPEVVLGSGILLAAGTGAAAWLFGEPFLSSGVLSLGVPLLGEVKAPSVLLFDIGVYAVVVGLVTGLLGSLGEEDHP